MARFGDLVSKRQKSAKAAGGSNKVSAQASKVLAQLREYGARLEGLTVEEVIHTLQLSKNTSQGRKAIRAAQIAAVSAGDLVYCEKTFSSVDSRGEVINLNNGCSRYYIVPAALAAEATEEDLMSIRSEAEDFVYNGEVGEQTRSVLAIHAREVFHTRSPREVSSTADVQE